MPLMNYRPLGRAPDDGRLGRFIPDDDEHIRKWAYSAIALPTAIEAEKVLTLPFWHWLHDQWKQGSCVGHGTAMERAITNTIQNRFLARIPPFTRRYDPLWFWNQAKLIDGWADTNPGDDNGTSVRAAYDVARGQGARRISTKGISIIGDRVVVSDTKQKPDLAEGVAFNRWATTVDEMRTALANGSPVVIGVNWYSNFDDPTKRGTEWWIGRGGLGQIRGGHCVCIYGASDKRQAFRVKNSWGREYPLVWLPYDVMATLLSEDGEASLQTDR